MIVKVFWIVLVGLIVAANLYYFVENVRMSGRTTLAGRLADSALRLFGKRNLVKVE